MVAVVGVAVGFQFHVLATSVTALTLVVLTLLGLLDRRRQAAGRAGARSGDSDQ